MVPVWTAATGDAVVARTITYQVCYKVVSAGTGQESGKTCQCAEVKNNQVKTVFEGLDANSVYVFFMRATNIAGAVKGADSSKYSFAASPELKDVAVKQVVPNESSESAVVRISFGTPLAPDASTNEHQVFVGGETDPRECKKW